MAPDYTRRWLRSKQARLNARWRLFRKRCRDVNHPTYIVHYQRYQEEARALNLNLPPSGRNITARRFCARWTFTGTMTTCIHCNATMWLDEKVRGGRSHEPRFRICCHFGQVRLPPLPSPPALLSSLFDDRPFMDNIRIYNSMLSFTSMGATIDYSVMDGRGPYTFRISGANYHQIGSLLPSEGQAPRFAQLYIYDTQHECRNRVNAFRRGSNLNGVNSSTIQNLQQMLNACNPYVQVFRQARDVMDTDNVHDLRIRIITARPGGQYIRPTADEVAALIVGGEGAEATGTDIIVRTLAGNVRRIYGTHPSYMALQYPLLFPFGTDGWVRGIPLAEGSSSRRECVTLLQYYAYRIQFRIAEVNILLRGGRLFLQFVVDCYTVIEHERLRYIRDHQNVLRIELYVGLEDAITAGESNASTIGRRCILPSSFTGGPRYMRKHFLDAMAICAHIGYPDFFITFTCNPNWPEIREALDQQPGQYANDRPDIVARVFRLRLQELMRDFKDKQFFGSVVAGSFSRVDQCHCQSISLTTISLHFAVTSFVNSNFLSYADIYVIEFQKRGLPHAHILITLAANDKPSCSEDIDAFICAELPDQLDDPLAYETVTKHMIHGPCGVLNPHLPCMDGPSCAKHYPKAFIDDTTIGENGFVRYRRRDDGRTILINGNEIDNRWVVPYNRDLCVKYDAHINVERCAQKKVIKYLHKYMHKGPDRATFVIEGNCQHNEEIGPNHNSEVDEITQYLDGRYVSAIDAMWRIFEFEITHRYPSVEMLQYHLPGQHNILFREDDNLADVLDIARQRISMLTSWFEVNMEDPQARQYTYAEFPMYYVWNRGVKKWSRRQQRVCIGRLPFANPNSGERYYLRMLLTVVRGAKCFADLRTVQGIIYPTFREACCARGIVCDNSEWDDALTEAATWATGAQLRSMFCSMLMYNEIAQPNVLWEGHWEDLTDDLERRLQRQHRDEDLQLRSEQRKDIGLHELQVILNRNGRSLKDFPPMPLPSSNVAEQLPNRLIMEQLDYDVSEEAATLSVLLPTLNSDQLDVFRSISNADESTEGGCFFVYGSGGTGKTYVWRAVVAALRAKGKITLSVASSGIAALLLPFGKTAHSMFKIPINATDTSYCFFSKHSELADLIRQTSLVIWDEAPMTHRHVFETVDRTFRDICGNDDAPFGGKLILFGGDFRQVLPVVPKGGRADTVAASISRSCFWPYCKLLHLRINMRLRDARVGQDEYERRRQFADWILSVGNGTVPGMSLHEGSESNWIQIPSEFLIQNDRHGLDNLISAIYPDLRTRYNDGAYMQERCILAATNNDVDQLNAQMLDMLPVSCQTYLSSDTFQESTEHPEIDDIHPPEILHGLTLSGLPNHAIQLKIGAPVVLLRNLDSHLGLCNGTRLTIERLGSKVLEARIITGRNVGQKVFIPRLDLTPSSDDAPFAMKRRQFPIKLAFAMTINKSQGQTLQHVGIYLPKPVFSHGQLYVAVSRVTAPSGLKILISNKSGIPDNVTKNVVYREIFNDVPDRD